MTGLKLVHEGGLKEDLPPMSRFRAVDRSGSARAASSRRLAKARSNRNGGGVCAGTTGAYPHGGVLDALLDDQPVEEAADNAQKMVVAARGFTLARTEEGLDERGIDS